MNWHDLLKAELESAYHATEGLMRLVTNEELDWKPSQENNWMTMGQLLKHLEDAAGSSFKGFITGDWGFPEEFDHSSVTPEDMLPPAEKLKTTTSVEDSLKALAADKALAFKLLDETPEEVLATQPAPAPWDPRPIPLGHRLLSMVQHLETHKSQLFYYHKLKGRPVNTGTLWGMA